MLFSRVLPFFALACSSVASPSPQSSADAGAGEASMSECAKPPGSWEEGRDPPAYCVREVSGTVQDSAGTLLAKAEATVCGIVCFGANTDASGNFRVSVNARLPDSAYVLFAHGRPMRGSKLIPLPKAPAEQLALGLIELPRLSTDGVPLPVDGAPAATIRTGAISFGIAPETNWELAFEDAADEVNGRMVRSAKVSADKAPAFAKGANLIYALAPFDAKPSKPVSVTLSETGGLASGTPVEFVVMGGVDLERFNGGGTARAAAKGHVSADGTSVSTDPGEGISTLTWLAVRASP
jgi:hypothetical protein